MMHGQKNIKSRGTCYTEFDLVEISRMTCEEP